MGAYRVPILVTVCLLAAAVCNRSNLLAEDNAQSATKFTFHLRTVDKPADPDPQQQTAAERLKTLRKRMAEANQLLEQEKYKEFVNDFIDPFWLARYAGSGEMTVEQLIDLLVTKDPKSMKRFSNTITKTLKMEPKWLLNGRAASFITDDSSHTAEFWIYYDGKWRISPET